MQWRHLLAASDHTPAGTHALRVATRLAERWGATLSVVVVNPPDGWQPDVPPNAKLAVLRGIPGIEIARLAETLAPDMIVLGRRLRGGPDDPHLGPTADQVVRRSTVPCLFVPAGQEELLHIVTALDGTDRGLKVLREAVALRAELPGVPELRVVTVERRDHAPSERAHGGSDVATSRELRIRQAMASANGAADAARLIVRFGDPVPAILGEVPDAARDVLVIGNHRGGPGGVPASTGVGRSLLYAAPCAVLTVPL